MATQSKSKTADSPLRYEGRARGEPYHGPPFVNSHFRPRAASLFVSKGLDIEAPSDDAEMQSPQVQRPSMPPPDPLRHPPAPPQAPARRRTLRYVSPQLRPAASSRKGPVPPPQALARTNLSAQRRLEPDPLPRDFTSLPNISPVHLLTNRSRGTILHCDGPSMGFGPAARFPP